MIVWFNICSECILTVLSIFLRILEMDLVFKFIKVENTHGSFRKIIIYMFNQHVYWYHVAWGRWQLTSISAALFSRCCWRSDSSCATPFLNSIRKKLGSRWPSWNLLCKNSILECNAWRKSRLNKTHTNSVEHNKRRSFRRPSCKWRPFFQ